MKIIILCHWFPPSNVIGAVRPYQLAKYLISCGHTVHVVTTVGNPVPETYDVELSKFEITRVPLPSALLYLEKSIAGILGVFKKIAIRLFYPDQYIVMAPALIRAAMKITPTYDLLISSALPFSIHICGAVISTKAKIPWVADSRDLWADTPYRRSFFGSKIFDLWVERKILLKASSHLVVGPGMQKNLIDRLKGFKNQSPVHVMMNGADISEAKVFSDYQDDRTYSFVYTGMLYQSKRDLTPLFEMLVSAKFKSKFEFYGAEKNTTSKYIKKYKNLDITAHESISKKSVKVLQGNSHFLILALGVDSFEKTVLTGKFFEYIECARPILAICDPSSDLGVLIRRYSLGCASRDPGVILEFVNSIIEKKQWIGSTPVELTRIYQMEKAMASVVNDIR